MNTRKHLLSAARLLLPTIGLSLICAGAYIKSIQSEQLQILRDISTYLFIILGFILLFAGVLWSLGHGMKNVLLKRSVRRSRDANIQVFIVDRSNFYPPSYEESQVRNNAFEVAPTIIPIPTGMQWAGRAPPLYTQTCYEISVEDFSHEEPPTYQQAVLQSQDDSQAAYLPTNSSVEPV
ncbi:transmembrane protein 252 [Pangasianodon hypophthalmus]|uniref:transmembrane protein 252 n=1 Tax=Pangasianodon hypophthalmus TaxID=310915 RepID=UPI000EFF5C9D|nr:transmembrane protein 252 [Pangasianodon hypophthalmus]